MCCCSANGKLFSICLPFIIFLQLKGYCNLLRRQCVYRAARVICNFAKDLPSAEALTRAKWDTLRTFYKQSILKLIYKMYHNDLPSCMTAHIVKLQPSYNLRSRLRLEIPPFKSNIKKYSISYRGPILWNHMPIECRNANSVKSFSRMINRLTLVREIDFSNLFRRR